MIEQCGFASLLPSAIEALEIARAMRQPAAGGKQERERQEHWDVHRDGAERVMPKSLAGVPREPGVLVVFLPAALISKPKATSKHILAVRTSLIANLNGLQVGLLLIGRFWARILLRIEVKKCFHATGENLGIVLSCCPECSNDATATIERRPYQCTSATHPLAAPLEQRKAVTP
jgi:hypothetical protein